MDHWMNDWEGSHSDGESMMSVKGAEYGEVIETDVATDDESSDDVSEHSLTSKPGFSTAVTLDCRAKLDVTVEFLKWDGNPVYNLVDITVEVSDPGGSEAFSALADAESVYIRLEVSCPDTVQDLCLQKWQPVSAASENLWTTEAKRWLHKCNYHPSCKPISGFQPTRLICIQDTTKPRLISRGVTPQAYQYAALSYVWGAAQSYVLRKESLQKMHVVLDVSRLPKTITDAVHVARQMGLEYLWVDALCIIQDSPEDKLRELPAMGDIYRESTLTIVAASASSANDGFLREPKHATFFVKPFAIEIDGYEDQSASLIFGYRETYKSSMDPISSRAWTLQERVLSRRLLIFSNCGVMWMCRDHHVNLGGPPDAEPPYQILLHSTDTDAETDDEESHDARLYNRWMLIRSDYTEMELTYVSDKLPAISALAAEISKDTGWTYVAGLWNEFLFLGLHWRPLKRTPTGEKFRLKPKTVKDAGYLAPSWSWASTGLCMIDDGGDERQDRAAFDFKVLECSVEGIGDESFRFGPVKSGFLVVEGRAIELPWRFEDRPDFDGTDVAILDADEDEDGQRLIVGEGTMDPLDDEIAPDVRLVCLGMSTLRLGQQQIVPVEGLLLLPTGSTGTFRRVGFFRMTAPSVFDGEHVRLLRIH